MCFYVIFRYRSEGQIYKLVFFGPEIELINRGKWLWCRWLLWCGGGCGVGGGCGMGGYCGVGDGCGVGEGCGVRGL